MKIRKMLLSLFSLLVCLGWLSQAYAGSQPQMYVGAQGGYANTNFSNSSVIATPAYDSATISSASVKNHVFAARGYAGYQFNDYIAVEAGYLRPRSTRYTNINGGTVPNGDVSEYGIDLTGKVFLPMAAYVHLSPYVKVGGVYMDAESQGGITRNGASDFGYSIHPLMGAGIGYDIMPSLTADISWTSITQGNSSLPRLDLLFLGLTYHFSFSDVKSGVPNYGDIDGTDS